LPGHDINYQSISGLLSITIDNEEKSILPKMPIADMISGLFATIGILTAIIEVKVNKGLGQYIDISMLDGLISCMTLPIIRAMRDGEDIIYDPGYGSFQTKDNRFISLGIYYEDWFWDRMCRAIGLDDIASMKYEERKKKKEILTSKLNKIFLGRNLEEWLNTLEKADVPATPVNAIRDAVDDKQIKSRSLIKGLKKSSKYEISSIKCPIKFSKYNYRDESNVPKLGESTEQILKNIGYLSKAISQMKKEEIT